MRYKVKITPSALADIKESKTWYNSQQKGLGNRFKEVVFDTIESIRKLPMSASFANEDVRYKVVPKFPFVIIYWINETEIVITRVYHTSRRPQT